MSNVAPYLHFNGDCEAAVKFYINSFGGDICFSTKYGDNPSSPDHPTPDNWKNKIMHTNFIIEGAKVMASDTFPGHDIKFGNNVTLSVNFDEKTAGSMAEKFNKLSAGGKVTMPLQKTFWAENFGMLVDKFGNSWMFNFEKKK